MSFEQGEKIACKDPGRDIGLIKDNIYTVVERTFDAQGEHAVMLLEAIPPDPFHNYLSWRFRKLTPEEAMEAKQKETIEL